MCDLTAVILNDNMKAKELNILLTEVEFLQTLSLEEKEKIELDDNIAYIFFSSTTEFLFEDYIKSIVFWYSTLKNKIDTEEFELAIRIREAIKFEEDEFKRLMTSYHKPKEFTKVEIIEAINLANEYTKKSFL